MICRCCDACSHQTHRKEAIYRQMLEYRRSYEQEARKANDLEAQKRVLEASVAAVEVCWQQVGILIRTPDVKTGY